MPPLPQSKKSAGGSSDFPESKPSRPTPGDVGHKKKKSVDSDFPVSSKPARTQASASKASFGRRDRGGLASKSSGGMLDDDDLFAGLGPKKVAAPKPKPKPAAMGARLLCWMLFVVGSHVRVAVLFVHRR